MSVILDALWLPTEDYTPDQVLESGEEVYTGFVEKLVNDDVIDNFYINEDLGLSEAAMKEFHPTSLLC